MSLGCGFSGIFASIAESRAIRIDAKAETTPEQHFKLCHSVCQTAPERHLPKVGYRIAPSETASERRFLMPDEPLVRDVDVAQVRFRDEEKVVRQLGELLWIAHPGFQGAGSDVRRPGHRPTR
jgi:hypothetical protein